MVFYGIDWMISLKMTLQLNCVYIYWGNLYGIKIKKLEYFIYFYLNLTFIIITKILPNWPIRKTKNNNRNYLCTILFFCSDPELKVRPFRIAPLPFLQYNRRSDAINNNMRYRSRRRHAKAAAAPALDM